MIRLALLTFLAFAVKPEVKTEWKITANANPIGEVSEIIFTGKIPDEWYIYGTEIYVQDGPLVAKVAFETSDAYEIMDKFEAIEPLQKYDEIWDGNVTYFKKEAKFRQKLKLLKAKPIIYGKIIYQICNEKDGQCVLKKDDFTLKIK